MNGKNWCIKAAVILLLPTAVINCLHYFVFDVPIIWRLLSPLYLILAYVIVFLAWLFARITIMTIRGSNFLD